MSADKQKQSIKLYRDYVRQEVRDPEILKAKKQFIEAYFKETPSLSPFGWLIPAAGFFLVCLLIYPVLLDRGILTNPVKPSAPASDVPASVKPIENPIPVAVSKAAGPLQPEKRNAAPENKSDQLPEVVVKGVKSDTGQIMIYKESYQDHPITIIWVFSGG